ncbi:amino acid permease [Mycolicibacterium mengxianglii]|uniref:amino acid permease n=1 Tax=Mycolicibacterium mengxianglii TaxID=2736649 RepID=UPI0018D11400|nr:amino acid permease [Mycolicibacterium mengxianglii]
MPTETGPPAPPPLPPSYGYTLKRLFLGKPLITDQLKNEKLSNRVALGVLSPDAISSSAYGTEVILIELLPYAALGAFALLLPITGVILCILILVAASYCQVVMTYTRAGGSYVVARDNFGPRVAQVAAAALLIDYVVTVAVQAAAGTVAVVSAVRMLGPYSLEITVGVVIAMCFVNLRGLREAGRPFAVPTYFFSVMMTVMITTGVVRHLIWGLPQYDPTTLIGTVPVQHADGLIMGATLLVLLRAFANGGASLTGVEAISNTVGSFREPAGTNARKVLVVMATVLAFLLAGVAYLAYATHAIPYTAGYPSVLSEIARAVFGSGPAGHVLYGLVQIATAAILFTGANTSFNGFPALANYVAEDRFLPRQLARRGQRLVFSNGIIVLTVLAVALLAFTGGSVNDLVPFYAIGVFTGFAMAGYGMSKHHLTHREPGWRYKLVINFSAGLVSTVVVAIFAIAKFTEGAWLVVVIFPILVFALIRLNREYRAEAAILEGVRGLEPDSVTYDQHRVFVLVNSVDLALLEALRYGRGLRADELTAVHFMIDEAYAELLRKRWQHYGLQPPLQIIDCPDRRLIRAAQELVFAETAEHPNTNVTLLLPRRSYSPVIGRLLHDRTADRIARAVSRLPHAAATIVPYDVQSRIRQAFPDRFEERVTRELEKVQARVDRTGGPASEPREQPVSPPPVIAVDSLVSGLRATIEGQVVRIEDKTRDGQPLRIVVLGDDSGEINVLFNAGRGADIRPGQQLRMTGKAHQTGTRPIFLEDPQVESPH